MVKLPKKVVIIASGVVVLTGASGATAFFIGKDRILGPSAKELAGVECTDVIRVADMRKDRAPWLRKYVRVPPGTDGMTRVKTALRVAKKVQETLPADLIEIAVLDQAGPDKRAQMRGRAIGAEVIVVRDAAKVPGITEPITIQYYQGAASGTGMFYGEEATMTSAEAEELLSEMKELNDCAPPPGKEEAGDKKGEKKKEKKPEKKPEKKDKKKEGEGHEAGAKEGEAAKPEEAKKEEPKKEEKPEVVFPNDVFGKMQKAAFQKAEAAKDVEEEHKKEEEAKKPGMFGKMMGMVGLGSKDEAEGEHGAAEEGGEHAAPAEEGGGEHAAPAEQGAVENGAANKQGSAEHAPDVTPIAGHDAKSETKADVKAESKHETKSEAPKPEKSKSESSKAGAAKSSQEASAEPEAKSGGFMSKMLGMVGLGGDKPKDTIEHSGGPSIVSGKKVIKGEEGKKPEGEQPAHGEEKASAHGEAPAAADHGGEPSKPAAEEHSAPAEHGAAAEPATPAAEATDFKPDAKSDHGAAADHGAETPSIDTAPAHAKPPADEASAHGDPVLETVNAADHQPAEADAEHPAAEPKKDDHAPTAHGG